MPKTRQKPALPAPAAPPARPPGAPVKPGSSKANQRLQSDRRWQRTKRYGWDSR